MVRVEGMGSGGVRQVAGIYVRSMLASSAGRRDGVVRGYEYFSWRSRVLDSAMVPDIYFRIRCSAMSDTRFPQFRAISQLSVLSQREKHPTPQDAVPRS